MVLFVMDVHLRAVVIVKIRVLDAAAAVQQIAAAAQDAQAVQAVLLLVITTAAMDAKRLVQIPALHYVPQTAGVHVLGKIHLL